MRKNLGEIYRARQRQHFKKYYANNREKLRDKHCLYQEVKRMERSGILKSADKVGYVKQVVSPNGEKLKIFSSNDNYYFQLNGFAKAVGYTRFRFYQNTDNLTMALDAKTDKFCGR